MSAWLYGAERVTDVVEQRAHDVLVVLAAAVGPGRRLQRVLEAVDGEAAGVALEQPEVGEHAVGRARRRTRGCGGRSCPSPRPCPRSSRGTSPGGCPSSRSSWLDATARPSAEPGVPTVAGHATHPVRRHPRGVPRRRSARSSSARPCPHHDRWEAEGIVDRALFAVRRCQRLPRHGGARGARRRRRQGLPLQRRHRRGAAAGRRQRGRARPDAAQRHLPAVLPAPHERRAEAALAAGHLRRRADHGGGDDRARASAPTWRR